MAEGWTLPALSQGLQVVLALAGLGLLVVTFGVWAVWAERRRLRQPARGARDEPVVPEPPAADASADALQQSLASLERFDQLQGDLRQRLSRAGQALEAERGSVVSAVQLMKQAAAEMRLHDTVYELYEGLRLLPRKSGEAQQADRDWHRQARIEPGRVLVLDESTRQTVVDFSAAGRALRISGRSYTLTRASFDELTLFDGPAQAVLTVRLTLQPDRLKVVEAVVSSYRPGPWVAVLVEARTLMDERREQLLLSARYRDVEKMRADFGLDVELPGWRPAR